MSMIRVSTLAQLLTELPSDSLLQVSCENRIVIYRRTLLNQLAYAGFIDVGEAEITIIEPKL